MNDFLTNEIFLDLGDQTLCVIHRNKSYITIDGFKIPKQTIKYIAETIKSMERGDTFITRTLNLEEGV